MAAPGQTRPLETTADFILDSMDDDCRIPLHLTMIKKLVPEKLRDDTEGTLEYLVGNGTLVLTKKDTYLKASPY